MWYSVNFGRVSPSYIIKVCTKSMYKRIYNCKSVSRLGKTCFVVRWIIFITSGMKYMLIMMNQYKFSIISLSEIPKNSLMTNMSIHSFTIVWSGGAGEKRRWKGFLSMDWKRYFTNTFVHECSRTFSTLGIILSKLSVKDICW